MAPRERFELPASATDPRIEAGRPDKLAITVDGTAVAPLGDGRVAIRNVSLLPASLRARGGDGPAAIQTPTAQPSATVTPRTTASPARPTARPTPTPTPTPAATPSAAPPPPAPIGNVAAPL